MGDGVGIVFKGWVPVSELSELEVVVEEVLKKEREFMSGQERRAKLIKKGQEAEKGKLVVVDIEVDEKKGLEKVEKTVQGWVREKREKTEGSVAESRGRWDRLW